MGFFRPNWVPGHGCTDQTTSRRTRLRDVAAQEERRARERAAARDLEGSLISLAALVGSGVDDPLGHRVGSLRDVVVRWTRGASHPAVTSFIVRVGRTDVMISSRWIEVAAPSSVRLRSAKAFGTAFEHDRPDVALAHDVLDRQVVDTNGVELVRPADVYLNVLNGHVVVAGIEVGLGALLRRLGPRRLRTRIRPRRVIDWAAIGGFSPVRADGGPARGRRSDLAGQIGSRLELEAAAPEVRRLTAVDVQAALEASPGDDGTPGSP